MWVDAVTVVVILAYFGWLFWREFKAWKRRHGLDD